MRILIIEDDELLGDGMQAILSQRGFEVTWRRDGRAGIDTLREDTCDILVLDLMLPRMPGLSVLREMRRQGDRTPVLVLTARSAIGDRVLALDSGADDYLTKPFDVEELCARIRALHRRSQGQFPLPQRIGELELNSEARTLTRGGVPVKLSAREFDLLQLLLEHRGRVLSRQRLEEAVYGWHIDVASNAVEVHIHHLRRKLGSKLIRTVRGVGYVIDGEAG